MTTLDIYRFSQTITNIQYRKTESKNGKEEFGYKYQIVENVE